MADEGTRIVGVVADDEAALLWFVVGVLSAEGYSILPATDGQQALQLIEHHGADIAFLVTDIEMPNLSGFDLAIVVRSRFPHIKIFFYVRNG